MLPVVVALKTAPDLNLAEPPVKTSISKITTGGFHLQVTVQIRPDLRPAALDAEITRILIAERILRNHAEITTKRSMVLPDWLLTGISQAMTFRDRSRPSAVFAAIFRSGKIYGIEEILTEIYEYNVAEGWVRVEVPTAKPQTTDRPPMCS